MKKILFICVCAMVGLLGSCGSKETGGEAQEVETFYTQQPVESGIYIADYYSIEGENARKGPFDGRVYFSLDPKQSAIHVGENGNRAKVNYTVMLSKPFEPTDSGTYNALDSKEKPVIVTMTDSIGTLSFEKGESKIIINFDKTPKSTGTPVEILEQINKVVK